MFCEREVGPGLEQHGGVHLTHVRTLPVGPLRTILFDIFCLIRAARDSDVIYMLGYGAAWAFWIPRLFKVPKWRARRLSFPKVFGSALDLVSLLVLARKPAVRVG